MTDTELSELRKALIIEEFKQLHEHLRTHEKEMGTLTMAMVTASTALLSAIAILYLRVVATRPEDVGPAYSYLFLAPILLVIPLMALIRGHRESLYKMGLYIKVFIEGDIGGAAWHLRLEKYQSRRKSESQDGVPLFAWVVSAIAYLLFAASLTQIGGVPEYHYAVPLALVFPLWSAQQSHREIKDISVIEESWRSARDEMDRK